jgi:curved DNA-binding protein CbpA
MYQIGGFLTSLKQISARLRRMMLNSDEAPAGPAGSLYRVLDVSPGASQETIVHAYRRQARASHPDARPDDPRAAARFRILSSAYEVLSDPVRRADYDRRTSGPARPVLHSGASRPRPEGPARTGEPRVGGGNSPHVFLGVRPQRPSGSLLWAGPVRVEARPGETFAEFRWPQTLRHPELDELTSLLLGFLTDGWSE